MSEFERPDAILIANLERLRDAAGKPVQALAREAAEVDPIRSPDAWRIAITRVFNGVWPSPDVLAVLARLYGVTSAALLTKGDEVEAPTVRAHAISTKEAAAMLGVSTKVLLTMARDGDIPCRRTGERRYLFVRELLEDWLLTGEIR